VDLVCSLIKWDLNNSGSLAFGSDGNLALLNAVAICYPSPLHLTCSDHKKSNIERKLGEYKATKAATKHVLSDIFGRKLASTTSLILLSSCGILRFPALPIQSLILLLMLSVLLLEKRSSNLANLVCSLIKCDLNKHNNRNLC
jgi:hypothetical protein